MKSSNLFEGTVYAHLFPDPDYFNESDQLKWRQNFPKIISQKNDISNISNCIRKTMKHWVEEMTMYFFQRMHSPYAFKIFDHVSLTSKFFSSSSLKYHRLCLDDLVFEVKVDEKMCVVYCALDSIVYLMVIRKVGSVTKVVRQIGLNSFVWSDNNVCEKPDIIPLLQRAFLFHHGSAYLASIYRSPANRANDIILITYCYYYYIVNNKNQ